MTMFGFVFFAASLFSFQSRGPIAPPAPVFPVPSESQMAWHEMERNAFVHFTVNTFTGKEWGEGDESPALFNPTEFDANQWARIFQEAGFKGVILTCKHHDGFCLWPSAYTKHSVRNSPYKDGAGDIVREVSDACKRYGLKFGVYVSPWDRNHAAYGRAEYIDYYRNQLRELFTEYGPLFEMWFDGANGGSGYYGGARETRTVPVQTYYDWTTTLNLVRSWNKDIIFFSDAGPGVRWCGNERGIAGETNWCTFRNDTIYAGKPGIEELLNRGMEDGDKWIPAEVDVSIRPGWFYHPEEDSLVKSPQQLFDLYLSSVGRGSTLLLNVPPDTRGVIHESDIEALRGWKELLDRAFRTNLALHAQVRASSFRGSSKQYAGAMVTDGKKETYWATDDSIEAGNLEIQLDKPQTMNYVVLQEYIRLGQRIRSFTIEAQQGGQWQRVASGTTVGYKRILRLPSVITDRIRVTINDAKACPMISSVELY